MTSVELWNKMAQFCFNAILWLPGYFSSMKIKKEFAPCVLILRENPILVVV